MSRALRSYALMLKWQALSNKPLLPLFGAYDPSGLRLLMDGLAHYPRSVTVSNERLGEEFAAAMGNRPACLMRGHGITSVGAAVENATLTAINSPVPP